MKDFDKFDAFSENAKNSKKITKKTRNPLYKSGFLVYYNISIFLIKSILSVLNN